MNPPQVNTYYPKQTTMHNNTDSIYASNLSSMQPRIMQVIMFGIIDKVQIYENATSSMFLVVFVFMFIEIKVDYHYIVLQFI